MLDLGCDKRRYKFSVPVHLHRTRERWNKLPYGNSTFLHSAIRPLNLYGTQSAPIQGRNDDSILLRCPKLPRGLMALSYSVNKINLNQCLWRHRSEYPQRNLVEIEVKRRKKEILTISYNGIELPIWAVKINRRKPAAIFSRSNLITVVIYQPGSLGAEWSVQKDIIYAAYNIFHLSLIRCISLYAHPEFSVLIATQIRYTYQHRYTD